VCLEQVDETIETGVLDDAVADYMASWTQMFSARSQVFHISVRAGAVMTTAPSRVLT
jgi:hypothetical protein